MALIDLPLAELERYRPAIERPADFDRFWETVLAEVEALPRELELERIDYPARGVHVTVPPLAVWAVRAWRAGT